MAQTVTFKVNGVERTVHAAGWEKLLDVLRLHLGLTGTKCGCDDYTCGACVVVVNGKAQRACSFPLKKIEGSQVVTIEGVADGEHLHPIQQALIDAGAVQCGYCIPGIVMELYALLESKPDASRDEILDALDKHMCRCTGYEAILEGALLAQARMRKARAG
ncbi:MAG: (2Fe-2S)-binding protein [Deltaproteobacteria bacterium]|nr:(2Fe-2S)-binding protein [Deltaproteobacteria bacterium]